MSEITPVFPNNAENPLPTRAECPGGVYLDTCVRPSRFLLRLHALVCIAAGAGVSAAVIPRALAEPWWAVFWVLALVGIGLCARSARAHLHRRWHLRLDRTGWYLAPEGGTYQPVRLAGRARLWPWLTTLKFRHRGGQSLELALAPDALAAEDYRRLRVWLVTQT